MKKRALIRNQNELNKINKQNERIQKWENLLEDIDFSRFFELATNIKIYVNSLNLHENRSEILGYTCDFEMIVSMLIGETEHKISIRFTNFDDFEIYIKAIDNRG